MTAGIRKHFVDHPDHFDPRQYIADGRTNVHDIVAHKIKDVLGSADRI
jgi:fructose-bisphosphate aldolase class II